MMRKLTCSVIISMMLLTSAVWFWEMGKAQNRSTLIPVAVNVGLVLDMDGDFGKMSLSCISMALSHFYSLHPLYKTRLLLHTRNSNNSIITAASVAQDLLNNVKVQAILGPGSSMQATFMISLGDEAQVPIITFSATSPSLASIRSPYFIRATLSDSSQVKAISALIRAFGWRAAVPVYVDNEFGEGIVPFLTDELQKVDARVPYRSRIHPSATDTEIEAELYKLMTMQTRVFVLHMLLTLGSRLFAIAKKMGMMSKGYVWIVTNGMMNDLSLSNPDPLILNSMQGVIGVRTYVPKSRGLDDFISQWKIKQEDNTSTTPDLEIFGIWAYDAAIALAMAVEKSSISAGTSEDLGKHIREVLSITQFSGLSGYFRMINGELREPPFQYINFGRDERVIGYWTSGNGIVKGLEDVNKTSAIYTTSKDNLEDIIWPSESKSTSNFKSAPKGWVIPTNEKTLRIGVPVKDENSEFVRLVRDSITNTTTVTGFSIAVFEAAMSLLPYYVPYEYIPFANSSGQSAGSYDELVYQVYLGNYDAVVGDVTILANRSLYVDFTLPYTESGVIMIAPIKDENEKNALVFLKPLKWDLWLATVAFFTWIAIVIWVIERNNVEAFGKNHKERLWTSLWFSFSTMVFSQKETVEEKWTKFVVIIWCFVVLVLTQSYTASLTSILTVQQLVPTVTTIEELKEKGEIVGYPTDSFIIHLLKARNITQLEPYNSRSDHVLGKLLSNGVDGKKGGISAAFDEIPYMKAFLSRHCSDYAKVGPLIRTDGFGFAFPIGSPLVPDVSRAILKITEGDKMDQITNAWFGSLTICPDISHMVSSTRLSLTSFWGLFLLVGAFSALPLIINILSMSRLFFMSQVYHLLSC